MSSNLSPELRQALSNSLAAVLGRLNGSLDFWTLTCLEEVVPDRHAFIQTQIERLGAEQDELTRRLAETAIEPECVIWWGTVCDTLEVVFAVLTRFRDFSAAERRSTVRMLSQLYHSAYCNARKLAGRLGLSVDRLNQRTAEHDSYFGGILDRLTEELETRCQNSEDAHAGIGNSLN